jgi:glycosyltransferase involved in cell wall biosynthesis
LRRAKHFDLIFIQREALLIGSSFFEKRFFKKSKVIFDFDDSIWLLDTSPENKKFEFLKNPDKTKRNITHAHAVIAGNGFLADYAKRFNPNVLIIPTTIDTDFHKPIGGFDYAQPPNTSLTSRASVNGSIAIPPSDKKIVIGWSGSISTIKHFEMIVPVLKKIQASSPGHTEIHVIGQGSYAHPELEIISKHWSVATEVENLQAFDIGIMPLPNDEWVKGKCGLKGLSYMACGVATVMSPVGVNADIIQHQANGLLAATEAEWFEALSYLIENPAIRNQLGAAGRQTVVEKYSVEANKHKYLEVLKSLIKQ